MHQPRGQLWERFEVIRDKERARARARALSGCNQIRGSTHSGGVGDCLSLLGFLDCKIGGVGVIIALLASKFRTSILVMSRGLVMLFFKSSRQAFVYIMEAEIFSVGTEVPNSGPVEQWTSGPVDQLLDHKSSQVDPGAWINTKVKREAFWPWRPVLTT